MTAFLIIAAFAAATEPDEKALLEKLQGEWKLEKIELDGKELEEAKGITIIIDKQTMKVVGKEDKGTSFQWNVKSKPMAMDVYEGETLVGKSIFELDGDTLRISGGGSKASATFKDGKTIPGKIEVDERPTSMDGKKYPVATFKRVKK